MILKALTLRATCGHPVAIGNHRDQLLPLLLAYRKYGGDQVRIETVTQDQLNADIKAISDAETCDTCRPPTIPPLPEGHPE